jgi:hypothetical protein
MSKLQVLLEVSRVFDEEVEKQREQAIREIDRWKQY